LKARHCSSRSRNITAFTLTPLYRIIGSIISSTQLRMLSNGPLDNRYRYHHNGTALEPWGG
jgi:hypothetical protein